MRWGFGHFNPDDHYEALVDSLVGARTRWLDVGCGRNLFPSNEALARLLASRCNRLVGVDPDATLDENPFVHEKVSLRFEDYRTEHRFDLVTMRMVAEHVEDPIRLAATLRDCTKVGGCVVVYTVNKYSPVPIITSLLPFVLHHPLKRVLWRSERKDTFPTFFRMNTRDRLRKIFAGAGFDEVFFVRLDDCRTTSGFKILQRIELTAWKGLRYIGLNYPEKCLLGVYQKTDSPTENHAGPAGGDEVLGAAQKP
jgi:SAM-dependent methyltransferase